MTQAENELTSQVIKHVHDIHLAADRMADALERIADALDEIKDRLPGPPGP